MDILGQMNRPKERILKPFTDEHYYKNRHFIIKVQIKIGGNGVQYYFISVYEDDNVIGNLTILSNRISSIIRRIKKSLEDYVDSDGHDLLDLLQA